MADGIFILVICIIALHLVITLTFTIRISLWHSRNANLKPSVSIIIAARNEFENLKSLIPALLNLDYFNFEICIGLDRCNDDSKGFLDSMNDPRIKYADIKETPLTWNSKKYALNEAIRLSNGEWLVFTDADCVPHSNQWLYQLSREMDKEVNCVIGISPYIGNHSLLSQYIRFEAFMTAFIYTAMALLGKPYMAVGRNMAIRSSFFGKIGGYSKVKSITGGDDDLLFQNGILSKEVAVVMGKDSIMETHPSGTWKNYFQQKLRHFSVGKHYRFDNILILSLYHLIHIAIYLAFITAYDQVYLIPIILFYLFIKLVGYRFAASKMGIGFNYILLPIVDITYAFFTPVLSIWSKLVKDIKWKN